MGANELSFYCYLFLANQSWRRITLSPNKKCIRNTWKAFLKRTEKLQISSKIWIESTFSVKLRDFKTLCNVQSVTKQHIYWPIWTQKAPNEALFNGLQILLMFCFKIFCLSGSSSRRILIYYLHIWCKEDVFFLLLSVGKYLSMVASFTFHAQWTEKRY